MIPIYLNPMKEEKIPKPTLFTWVGFYLFNWSRKPFVWFWQRELKMKTEKTIDALHDELLPTLLKSGEHCPRCMDAFCLLQPQVFLSQIKLVLERLRCNEHPLFITSFLQFYKKDFDRAEELARKINGL